MVVTANRKQQWPQGGGSHKSFWFSETSQNRYFSDFTISLQQQHAQPRQQFPPIPGHGEHLMQRNNIVEFKKLAPPAFKGTIEPLEADNWIMKMEKAFAVQECHDEEKIRYTAYLLQGEAYNWWRILEQKYEHDRIPLT